METWLIDHWFDLLSAIGIVGGLVSTSLSLRSDAHTRRIENLLTLTRNHRELWEQVLRYPALSRVLEPQLDLSAKPVTREERIFVNFVIQHLNSAHEAMNDDLVMKPEALRRDIGAFFALPIPQAAWASAREFQSAKFVRFVDECLATNTPGVR